MSITTERTPEELLARCVAAAQEAGQLLLEMRRSVEIGVTKTKSSPTDIVTNADGAAEALLRQRLFDSTSHDRWLGEESGTAGVATDDSAAVRWIVDPLDGTVNYLYDLPGWAVSVAAERQGEVIAGCVVMPTVGETFAAVLGGGATCNGRPVSVSSCDDLSQALVATGFSYDPGVRVRQGQVVAELLPLVRDIRRNGSAATDFCSLAAGRVDAYYETGLQPWDRAGGVLIAREAGARVEVAGDGSVVASNPSLFDQLSNSMRASLD